jgi:deoxyribodipyrimidine photo-lyase
MGRATIWWIRRDLRLGDNQALAAALGRGGAVVPLFVCDPELLGRIHTGAKKRAAFLFGGLAALDGDLRTRGARLIVRRGRPETVVAAVAAEVGAELVVAEEDTSSYGRRRDAAVASPGT